MLSLCHPIYLGHRSVVKVFIVSVPTFFRASLLSVNLETRFLLKGEDHNTLCYEVLKPFIKVLIKDYQVVNTLLGKPSQSLNDFNFDLDVNPRILFYEPKPFG
jgi:hypothetical protein